MAQPATNAKIEELKFRLKTDPKSRIFFPLAEELRKVNQQEEAEQVLRTGLTNHPTYLSAWVSLGRILGELGKNDDAVETLKKALQLDNGNVVAARLLADSYLALGEKVEAIKKYKLVHALMPADDEVNEIIDGLEQELNPIVPVALSAPEEEAPAPPAAAHSEHESLFGTETAPTPEVDTASPFAATDADDLISPFAADAPPSETEVMPTIETPMPYSAAPLPHQSTIESPFFIEPPSAANDEAAGDETATLWPSAEPAAHAAADTTGDDEPMSVAHSDSPFEDSSPGDYGVSAFAVEEPQGFHETSTQLPGEIPHPFGDESLDETPLAATPEPEVPVAAAEVSPWDDQPQAVEADPWAESEPAPWGTQELAPPKIEEHLTEIVATAAPETAAPAEEPDVFAPASEPVAAAAQTSATVSDESPWGEPVDEIAPAPLHAVVAEPFAVEHEAAQAPVSEDFTNTITMADLYARQGLVEDARHIYENILQRDPGNVAVRGKLSSLTTMVEPLTPDQQRRRTRATLERWLTKVGKRDGEERRV